MKRTITYLFFMAVLAVLISSCGASKEPGLPDMRETFSKKDKNPFGANIAYRQVQSLFPANSIRDIKQPFSKTWKDISDTASLYVCISSALFVDEEEATAMIEYVNHGNDLFISAGYIDELLQEKLNCKTKMNFNSFFGFSGLTKTNTRSLLEPDSLLSYFYYPFNNYFTSIDTGRTRIVGVNANSKPNSIVYFYGRGRLYLHCDPRAFSNYFLLKDSNYKYLQQSLAFTSAFPQHVYWDDYYNKLRRRRNSDENFSTFSEIMKHPPLVYAFWISVVLLLFYVLFGGKRVQRIIAQRKPNENTTVTFTETIGRLYLQKKDNKNISDKMITYFNEFIRNKYFLNTNLINDDFITTLGRKSGVPRDKVESLYRSIADVQSSDDLDDYRLLSLNEQIQHFHKNKN
ncbi:MAG: hypothetical protein IPP96_17730 [Chitinophagaceae bacterium]|nr:hypothetical protein [Chitinophagaceae bacterium]